MNEEGRVSIERVEQMRSYPGRGPSAIMGQIESTNVPFTWCQQLETLPAPRLSRSAAPSVIAHVPSPPPTSKSFFRSASSASSFSITTPAYKYITYRHPLLFCCKVVFALSGEETTRCWAPAWKDRSDSREMLGISRGYTLDHLSFIYM